MNGRQYDRTREWAWAKINKSVNDPGTAYQSDGPHDHGALLPTNPANGDTMSTPKPTPPTGNATGPVVHAGIQLDAKSRARTDGRLADGNPMGGKAAEFRLAALAQYTRLEVAKAESNQYKLDPMDTNLHRIEKIAHWLATGETGAEDETE